MKYRIYAQKPAISMSVTGLTFGMVIWHMIKLLRVGMKVTIESEDIA